MNTRTNWVLESIPDGLEDGRLAGGLRYARYRLSGSEGGPLGCVLPQDRDKWAVVARSGTFPQWNTYSGKTEETPLSDLPEISKYLSTLWRPFSLNGLTEFAHFLSGLALIDRTRADITVSGKVGMPSFTRIYGLECLEQLGLEESFGSWMALARRNLGERLHYEGRHLQFTLHEALELLKFGIPCMVSPFEHRFEVVLQQPIICEGAGEDFADLDLQIPKPLATQFESFFEHFVRESPYDVVPQDNA